MRLTLAVCLCLGFPALGAQSAPVGHSASDIDKLARALATQLTSTGIETVVVFDLAGPDGQWLPFGSWLADRFSIALANAGSQLEVTDRTRLALQMDDQHLAPRDVIDRSARVRLARSMDVDGFIEGSFGPFKDQIGVTLVAWRTPDEKQAKIQSYAFLINGKIPLESETASHLSVALESLRPSDGVFKAGRAGMTVAQCDYCPAPQFPAALVWRLKEGTVVTTIVVSPEGRATEVKVIDSPDIELNAVAINAIRDYRFKPAVDPDGNPGAVRMPFAVMFRINH